MRPFAAQEQRSKITSRIGIEADDFPVENCIGRTHGVRDFLSELWPAGELAAIA